MIDIHAHILPGVDDGSPSMEDSIEMARLALQSGVRAMIATPHCDLPGVHCVAARDIPLRVDLLTHALREAGLPLRIYPGMEIFGTPQTAERLKSGALCTLASSRYPLIEFPFADYGPEATDILHSVLRLGLRPIVAHPERYAYTQTQPQLLSVWVSMGCLLQINRGSLLGRFGERAETLAHRMLERGFVSFVASDAHYPPCGRLGCAMRRPFCCGSTRPSWHGSCSTKIRAVYCATLKLKQTNRDGSIEENGLCETREKFCFWF
jgi:hypothetical protein